MQKTEQLIGRLTPAERRSLRKLGAGQSSAPIPFRHETRLIDLGLAEIALGESGLTPAGRRAIALLSGWRN